MYKVLVGAFIMCFIFGAGCVREGYEEPDDKDTTTASGIIINPNGDTELALLMREMFDDGMRTKSLLLAGAQPEVRVDYAKMLTAEATEPEKVATEDYRIWSQALIESMEALQDAPAERRPEYYQRLVATCMQCHTAMCPGPKMKISKMYLSDQQLASLGALQQ